MTTFVLIHGQGTGGWLWDDVAERLRAAGHDVHAPTLVGVGELAEDGDESTDVSTHVEQVTELIESHELADVVLVGFSYGGYVITGVADAVPQRIARLVYLDGFVPQAGKCFFDVLPPPVRAAMENAAANYDGGWHIPPGPVAMVGGVGALEPEVHRTHVDAMLARRGPHPIGTYREVMPAPFQRSADVPRVYVSCTDKPPNDPTIALAGVLRANDWAVHELPTGALLDAVDAVCPGGGAEPLRPVVKLMPRRRAEGTPVCCRRGRGHRSGDTPGSDRPR